MWVVNNYNNNFHRFYFINSFRLDGYMVLSTKVTDRWFFMLAIGFAGAVCIFEEVRLAYERNSHYFKCYSHWIIPHWTKTCGVVITKLSLPLQYTILVSVCLKLSNRLTACGVAAYCPEVTPLPTPTTVKTVLTYKRDAWYWNGDFHGGTIG